MNNSLLAVLTLILSISTNLVGQEDLGRKRQEIGIQFGFSKVAIKEQRFSNLTKRDFVPKLGLIYQKWNNKTRQELELTYRGGLVNAHSNSIWYKLVNTEVNYSLQKNFKDVWLGANVNSSTVFTFPDNTRRLFGNNSISYTIINSIGLALNKDFSLIETEENLLQLSTGIKTPFIAHVIRPAYAHPYPESYLNEEVFDPLRSNMGSSIAKSGKIRLPNKYRAINISIGINYVHQNSMKLGLRYELSSMAVKENKQLNYRTQDLSLLISYLY